MITVWGTADLHFFDEDIIRYENRPFKSVEEMNETLIKNWNDRVDPEDIVFVLGDVSAGDREETSEIIHRLKGHKILIMGNHDRDKSPDYWLSVGFDEVSRYPIICNGYFILSHEPPSYFQETTPYAFFYGHVHSTSMYQTVTEKTACVCVERWNYAPAILDKVTEQMCFMKLKAR